LVSYLNNTNIKQIGFINFEKTDEFMESCDALLATSVKVINGEDYCIAGKTFDYITMNKPILGFVTEGAQKQFIENTNTGIICNPDDINNSVKTLKYIFDNGLVLNINKEYIQNFHRKYLTKQLSEIINLL